MVSAQSVVFVVDAEPYCLWDVDLKERNLEFLNGIDPGYFDYVLRAHLKVEPEDIVIDKLDELRAATALRITYHHALDTLFSLLGAYVQAPDCAYAWIAKCTNKELRNLTRRISNGEKGIFTKLKLDRVTWSSVAGLVLHSHSSDADKWKAKSNLFAAFWGTAAASLRKSENIDEYNSLKHGFRGRSGGFHLAVAIEDQYGEAPSNEKFTSLGGSKFGTSYFRVSPTSRKRGERSLTSRRTSLNWSIEQMIVELQLLSNSIQNVTSALRIANGVSPAQCRFEWPKDDGFFDKRFQSLPGITNMNLDFVVDARNSISTTRQQLLDVLRRNLSDQDY